jgi:hypothetical protein
LCQRQRQTRGQTRPLPRGAQAVLSAAQEKWQTFQTRHHFRRPHAGGDPQRQAEGLLSVTQKNQIEPNQTYLTPGGAFSGSGSAYGTFGQGENLFEVNDGAIGANRCMRGGCWWANNSGATAYLQSSGRAETAPTGEHGLMGFRLAAVAKPEIAVEQPAGSDLADGGAAVTFGDQPTWQTGSRHFRFWLRRRR